MRNISFGLTTEQFLDGTQTVTRRLGWRSLKPGDRLMGVEKSQGLRKGEKVKRLGEIEVVSVRRETLTAMTGEYGREECRREGFPQMSALDLAIMYCKAFKCTPFDELTRIEFRRVGADERADDGNRA